VSGYSLPSPIAEDDDTNDFDSGEPSLDEYLRRRALANHVQGASRCFVTCRDERVVGYYALASASVQHSDVAGKVRRNMPDPVPVILLSRLAVDLKEQGTGLGKNLLRDAILRSIEASEIIGVRALLVHALHDNARAFYAHFDFEPSPTDPLHLLLLIKDARAIVGR
jgi:predicted N-acetyltransferase YhbS